MLPKSIYIKDLGVSLSQISKHFTLGDNGILSKFEFVYILKKRHYMPDIDYKDLTTIVKGIIETNILVRNLEFKYSPTSFEKSLTCLKEFHLLATTKLKEINISSQSKQLIPCTPQIYFILDRETFKIPTKKLTQNSGAEDSEIEIFSSRESLHERSYRIWISQRRNYRWSDIPKAEERATRINILRLHAEACNMNNVFRGIIKGAINVNYKSEESDTLQNYIVKTISHLTKKHEGPGSESINYAKTIFNDFLPDELSILEERIETFNFRPQLTKNINQLITIYMEEIHNTINNGDGDGVVNSIGNGNTITNTYTKHEFPENYDYDKLALELEDLRQALKSKIDDDHPEHYEDIGKVGLAKQEASKKDGNKAIHFLKNTDQWVLGVAKEIGVDLVTEILKKQAGL